MENLITIAVIAIEKVSPVSIHELAFAICIAIAITLAFSFVRDLRG